MYYQDTRNEFLVPEIPERLHAVIQLFCVELVGHSIATVKGKQAGAVSAYLCESSVTSVSQVCKFLFFVTKFSAALILVKGKAFTEPASEAG